jgi:hypothetical protein
MLGVSFRLAPSSNVFGFRTNVHRSMGRLAVHVHLQMSYYAAKAIDVVHSVVPPIIGLDYVDETQMYVDNVDDHLVHKRTSHSLPLWIKSGHLYTFSGLAQLFTTSRSFCVRMLQFVIHLLNVYSTCSRSLNLTRPYQRRAASSRTFASHARPAQRSAHIFVVFSSRRR